MIYQNMVAMKKRKNCYLPEHELDLRPARRGRVCIKFEFIIITRNEIQRINSGAGSEKQFSASLLELGDASVTR